MATESDSIPLGSCSAFRNSTSAVTKETIKTYLSQEGTGVYYCRTCRVLLGLADDSSFPFCALSCATPMAVSKGKKVTRKVYCMSCAQSTDSMKVLCSRCDEKVFRRVLDPKAWTSFMENRVGMGAASQEQMQKWMEVSISIASLTIVGSTL